MLSDAQYIVTDSIYVMASGMFGYIPFELNENISWLTLDSTGGNQAGYVKYHISNPNSNDSVYIDSIMVTSQVRCNSPQYLKIILDTRFSRGDFNLDSNVDMDDIMSVVDYFFLDGAPPVHLDYIDMDSDGNVDIQDLIDMIELVF